MKKEKGIYVKKFSYYTAELYNLYQLNEAKRRKKLNRLDVDKVTEKILKDIEKADGK
ncbi:MAG: hypothetical protein IJM94_06715 [Clostridia bacterium]|nr:hypothetical protein [Clostridia bacterium]